MTRLRLAVVAVLTAGLLIPSTPAAASPQLQLVRDTWRSFAAMTVSDTGMPPFVGTYVS